MIYALILTINIKMSDMHQLQYKIVFLMIKMILIIENIVLIQMDTIILQCLKKLYKSFKIKHFVLVPKDNQMCCVSIYIINKLKQMK